MRRAPPHTKNGADAVNWISDVLATRAPSHHRHQGAEPAGRTVGGLWLDGWTLRVRTAIDGSQPVKLTTTEFAILAALLDQPGRVLLLAASCSSPRVPGRR